MAPPFGDEYGLWRYDPGMGIKIVVAMRQKKYI
jgi:hypothetical protein